MGSLLLCPPFLWENSSVPRDFSGSIMVLSRVSQGGSTSGVLKLKVSLDPVAAG